MCAYFSDVFMDLIDLLFSVHFVLMPLCTQCATQIKWSIALPYLLNSVCNVINPYSIY